MTSVFRKLLNIVNESANQINDAWFKTGSFETYKVPAVERYDVALEPGVVQTLEGPVKYESGYYIMTGPKGEQYPISPEKFHDLKDDLGNGRCTPKKIIKLAKLADHDGVVHASWGDLNYSAGKDYIVRHGLGDYGVVKVDIFNKTYDTSNI